MFKKSIFLFSLLLLISGCVERGQNIKPNTVIIVDHKEKRIHTGNRQEDKESSYVLHLNANEKAYDTLKNSISGSLLIIIGLIIFL